MNKYMKNEVVPLLAPCGMPVQCAFCILPYKQNPSCIWGINIVKNLYFPVFAFSFSLSPSSCLGYGSYEDVGR